MEDNSKTPSQQWTAKTRGECAHDDLVMTSGQYNAWAHFGYLCLGDISHQPDQQLGQQ